MTLSVCLAVCLASTRTWDLPVLCVSSLGFEEDGTHGECLWEVLDSGA